MTWKKLRELRRELDELKRRKRNLTEKDLISFAKRIGRKRSNRGDEPTYVSELLPRSNPISIPGHRGHVKVGTAGNILDQFEADLDILEESATEGDSNEED